MDTYGDGQIRELFGKDAIKAILNMLANWPKAERFAADVCNFYEKYLHLILGDALESSRYQIDLQHEPLDLKRALIELKLDTPRLAEALVHELLHLNIRLQGYPFGSTFTIPFEMTPYASFFSSYYPKLLNIIEHEIMFDDFLELGFDKENFLGCVSPPHDYQKLASETFNYSEYTKSISYSWWCLEYFRHWVSARHCSGNTPGAYAYDALFWGSKAHPEMKETVKKIQEIVDSGAIKDVKKHHCYVNQLFEIIRIPLYTSWVVIRGTENSNLVAVPIMSMSHNFRNSFELLSHIPSTAINTYAQGHVEN